MLKMKKHETTLLRFAFMAWALWVLCSRYLPFLLNGTRYFSYYSWPVSEWMINYQGGFVRRGLAGELLYQLYQISPYPIFILIIGIATFFFSLLLWLLIRLFKQEGLAYHFFFLAPCFLVNMFMLVPFWTRRDHLSLLITWLIFVIYSHFIHEHKKGKAVGLYVCMCFASTITLLLHEAAFFYTIPVLFIHYFLLSQKKYTNLTISFIKSYLIFLPAIITMAIVCIYKGDDVVAKEIWNSWQPTMNTFPLASYNEELAYGAGVDALTWDTMNTMRFHLRENFTSAFYKMIPRWPFVIYNIIAIYYLVTRINTVDLKWSPLKPVNTEPLSNILIIQGCCMLPMFTVLSCDWGRTIPYWLVTTFIAYHYFKQDTAIMPRWLCNTSKFIQAKIENCKTLNNPWCYIGVLVTLPFSACGPHIESIEISIILRVFETLVNKIMIY